MNKDRHAELSSIPLFTPLVLTVPDLDEALDYFTHRLGFRVDMVVPADAPKTAVISNVSNEGNSPSPGANPRSAPSSELTNENDGGEVRIQSPEKQWSGNV